MVDAPERIWTVFGKHGLLAFKDERPHSTEYVRADLAALRAGGEPADLDAEIDDLVRELASPDVEATPEEAHPWDDGNLKPWVDKIICRYTDGHPKKHFLQNGEDRLLVDFIRSALVSAPSDLKRELDEARAELIVAPAECGSSCDDPECPYSHKPLTLRQAYENAVARLRSAEAERDALAADKARLAGLVERAQHNVPQSYVNWHDAARAALTGTSDPAEARREALEEAETQVRQALIDAAYVHRGQKQIASGIFKAEVYATNAIRSLISTTARREGE